MVVISSNKGDTIIQKPRLLDFLEPRTCEVSHRAMMICNSSDRIHKKHNSLMELIIRNNKLAWNKQTGRDRFGFSMLFFFFCVCPINLQWSIGAHIMLQHAQDRSRHLFRVSYLAMSTREKPSSLNTDVSNS